MNHQTTKINGKEVLLSQPYNAQVDPFIGKENEIKLILASWMSGKGGETLSPLLLGAPGTGKNRIVYECAKITKKPLYIINGHDDLSPDDLAVSARISDNAEKKIDYILSPLVSAMINGGICFFDEIAKCGSKSLSLLASVLDERRYIDSTLLGERIFAHPGFRFIAATNNSDLQSSYFPDFIRSRLRPVIEIGYPSSEEVSQIIKTRYSRLNGSSENLMKRFWKNWQQSKGDRAPVPRDVINIIGLAINLADIESYSFQNGTLNQPETNSINPIKGRHLDSAFNTFYSKEMAQ